MHVVPCLNMPRSDGRVGAVPRSSRATALALALAVAAAAAPQWLHAQAAGKEWTTALGTPQGTRFSELNQITNSNVSTLVEEFAFATGTKASHQGQPLVIGTTMYVVTPFPNKLIALDLRTPGKVLWTFNPNASEFAKGVACCDVVNRGAAYANGKIIYNVLDDTTVAVDAVTGKLVWRTRLGNVRSGETLTGAPIVVKDKVIVGNAGGELGVRGWVQALNVNTGAPVWKGFNTGPDADVKITAKTKPYYAKDRGTNLGSTTWGGSLWQQGGATSWAWLTYDPDLNLVYHGTANPGVWNPDMRPGDNKWGASIFARNADTGEVAWVYQLTPHESWDFDAMNESIAVDLTIGGRVRKALVHFDKNGFAYTLDRATGEVISAPKYTNVTWASHVDLATGVPAVNPGMYTHEGVITKNICPTPLGAKEFVPAAFSPRTQLFYVPGINACNNMEPLRANYISGTPFIGMNLEFTSASGEFFAWDAAHGIKAWSIQEPLPLYSGVLATAGDVVFYGTLDKWFKAIDAKSGKLLFQKQLECGITSNPIAYLAPDGKQRIAVYTGTGYLNGGFSGGPCPQGSVWGDDGAEGTSVVANAARKTSRQGTATAAVATVTSGYLHVFKLR